MADTTARLELVKPEYTETADIEVINDNMDTIDGAVGVSIVNTVADIPAPFNGQFAYELTFKELHFFINGEWLLVAAGDQNSGNPDRIRLPAGSLNDLDDTTNAFQIGADDAQNLAVDQNEIQSRNNESAATLYLNEQGGDVHVGPDSEIVITNKGFKSDNMDSKEAVDVTNINVASTSWSDGPGDPCQVDCEAPPSGKILVILCGKSNMDSSGNIEISYRAWRPSGGADVVDPGGEGNTIKNAANSGAATNQNNLTSTIADLVKGLNAGDNYRFRVQHRKDSGGTSGDVDFRKIIAIPQV